MKIANKSRNKRK